jgi:hypothetical protein
MYKYHLEELPGGRWRWTVFREDHKSLRSGSAKDEHEAKLAALYAIDRLKREARKLYLDDLRPAGLIGKPLLIRHILLLGLSGCKFPKLPGARFLRPQAGLLLYCIC